MSLQLDQVWNLLRSSEVQLVTDRGEVMTFRVEQFQHEEALGPLLSYRFRVFRYDMFRLSILSTASDDASGKFADHEILVVDPMFDMTVIESENPTEAWKSILNRMEKQFRIS